MILLFPPGEINGAALVSTSKNNNFNSYQKTPDPSVYQSLKKEQHNTDSLAHPLHPSKDIRPQRDTGKPIPTPRTRTTGHLSNRAKVTAEQVCVNDAKQPDVEQGNMPEPLYYVLEGPDPENDFGTPENNHLGDTQDPLYVVLEESGAEKDYGASAGDNNEDTPDPSSKVLEGSIAEPIYEFQDVGDTSIVQEPMYVNALKGPETKQGPQEPLYNVFKSSEAQNSCPGTQGPHGSINETLYNDLEDPDSDAPYGRGMDYTASNLPFYLAAYDNPAYDKSLESDIGYGIVRRPGTQRESVYEPLRGPDRNDLYQALSKGGTFNT